MTFKSLFGQIIKLSLSFITFRVSRFLVSHLTHETVKLGLQNTLNMSKTTRVYFGVLHEHQCIIVGHNDPIRVYRRKGNVSIYWTSFFMVALLLEKTF